MTTSPPPPPPPGQHPPGWWQASDGNWYPPQGQAQPPPGWSLQQAKKKGGRLKRAGIAVAALVVLGVITALAGGGGDDEASNVTSGGSTKEANLFPDRPDKKAKDKERIIGQSADLSGYTATVSAAAFQQSLNSFQTAGYLVADVELRNRDDKAQPYNPFSWKLITPAGTIIDPTFGANQLGSGDLVKGGVITSKISWEVGTAKGDSYIIYDPPGLDEDRAVWKITI